MFKHGFPSDWSTLKKLIWLVGSGIAGAASGIWKTVTGTLIHITDALASPMQKCEVTFKPIQDLHGQDAPYPAGGGKNLLNPQHFVNRISGGTTVYEVNGDTIKVNANDGTAWVNITGFVLKAGTYTFTVFPQNSVNVGGAIRYNDSNHYTSGGEYTFTLNADTEIKIKADAGSGVTYPYYIKFQIESGSTSTDFSPYSNICPITGWTGCEVTRTGKNLYPYTTIPAYNYAWYSGSKALADATNPVFLKGGKKYAVSADQSVAATTSAIVRAWRADGTILENAPNVLNLKDPVSGTTAVYQATPKYYQLSTPNYAKPFTDTIEPTEDLWVDMRCSGDNRVGNDPMLQVGDSRTNYEPYQGTTLSVTFPDGQTVYGGKYEFVSGGLKSNLTKIVFDGSDDENWVKYGSGSASGYAMTINVPTIAPKNAQDILSNYLPSIERNDTWGNYGEFVSWAEEPERIATGIRSITTVEDWKAYLAQNPLEVVCELATPIEIQLTPQEISTLKGENNVWSNSNGDITIIYKAQAE